MKTIDFSSNWNKKLGCDVFPTFRLADPDKFRVGEIYNINLDGKPYKQAKLIDFKTYMLDQVTDYMAYLDTGTNAKEFKNLVQQMYKHKPVDLNKSPFYWLLLQTEQPVQKVISFEKGETQHTNKA